MFGSPRSPAAAYASVGIETAVPTADPHKLILLLFEGAELAISVGKMHMTQGNIAEKGSSISKAIDIITNGLNASLDHEAGGDLTIKLGALYDYMARRLLWANMKNNAAALDEVTQLLRELHGAWAQIAPGKELAA
ncbi:flagellar export chaperone FliS [Propionivibrio sp.]|uniref:flagellar export chaperone FliS n=1 Tax=Propionivibrio sp. TaxID=2212460 RepID=UPI0025EEEB79|nr:flagellar export chaperone FliS [Propionivibrio sp.]MBK7355561.1 flagellar export chaperone FliS [Propionivibrio sp.]MBK8400769.1 flagellar export chaperone FliS [Propionivibrio sp.]MBK8744795.1 flagellar export chaperone FliS [Propionivibrio sp.]